MTHFSQLRWVFNRCRANVCRQGSTGGWKGAPADRGPLGFGRATCADRGPLGFGRAPQQTGVHWGLEGQRMQTGVHWGLEGRPKAGNTGTMPSLYLHVSTWEIARSKFDVIKISNVKLFVDFIFVRRGIIRNIRK